MKPVIRCQHKGRSSHGCNRRHDVTEPRLGYIDSILVRALNRALLLTTRQGDTCTTIKLQLI